MIAQIEKYIALFFIYSFCGWTIETIRLSIKEKKFINRGFLIGPYCPIYGVGALLVTILLQKYKDDIWITFFMSLLIFGTLEYVTSYLMEKLFKARWWDYSQRKFNINGRICLENLILFSIGGALVVFIFNPFFIKYINMMPTMFIHISLIILSIIFLIDLVVSFKIILNLKEMSKEFKDNTVEISEKVKKIIRKKYHGYGRLVNSFPRIKDNVLYEKWEDMKKKIEESKDEFEKMYKKKKDM